VDLAGLPAVDVDRAEEILGVRAGGARANAGDQDETGDQTSSGHRSGGA
jgi:hypothetical protein